MFRPALYGLFIVFSLCVIQEPAFCQQQQRDPLNLALGRAGMQRSDLGWSPKGWWLRYPHAAQYKLDHFDDLQREPLATVPFTRTLAQAVREFLGPQALAASENGRFDSWGPLGSHSLYRLVRTSAVEVRYRAPTLLYASRLAGQETPLDQAVLALYRAAGEPTQFHTAGVESPKPDIERRIRDQVAHLSPEVSRVLGRLVLDVVDARREAALAFRNVTLEQRLKINQRLDLWDAIGVTDGLEYNHVHVFDDVVKTWDEAALWFAGLKCIEAMDRARRRLETLTRQQLGWRSFDWETPFGWIRVRGAGAEEIDATDALLVVDLGGNDKWRGPVGASSATRLVGLALDLSGDDIYEGRGATQGTGIAGVGVLLDAQGNDRYTAEGYAQGAGQVGLGALIDLAGDDTYRAGHSAQGAAAFGVGYLADANGNDRYELLASGQGYGGPGGVGILADRAGDDTYYAEHDPRKSDRPYIGSKFSASTAQGVGLGRTTSFADGRVWAGGLGALVDIEGKDRYIAGSVSQGTAFEFGTGLLFDGSGDDRYEGGDTWTQATAAHWGIGVLVDEGGDDVHLTHGDGVMLALAAAHDFSVAVFAAKGGSDRYTNGGLGFGRSLNRSVALFIDVDGNDFYHGQQGSRPGFAVYDPRFAANEDGTGTITDPLGLANPYFAYVTSLAMFLDVGGVDRYWGGFAEGAVSADEPGSDNWKVRNVGVAMDTTEGVIDWRAAR